LLRALHDVSASTVEGLVDVDNQPLDGWLSDARDLYEKIDLRVERGVRLAIDAFFGSPPPRATPELVFSHNDLGMEHVLIDQQRQRITGVLDWTDAAMVDPAYDFGLIYRDLGPVLKAALAGYGARDQSRELRHRAVFYGRCSVFEDIYYGDQSGREEYVLNGLRALAWLFP
jgi:aminoglycoside phosphotransferase (APT) family kinase protein